MVTLYDVAERAGVSIATVSRVLHGQDTVRDSTRDRVRTAIAELGYVPDGAAQSLARNHKDVIGLVCVEHAGLNLAQYDSESMSLLFYDGVLRGVESRLREGSWSLLLTFLREDEADLPALEPDLGPGDPDTSGSRLTGDSVTWDSVPGDSAARDGAAPVLERLLALSGKVDGLLIGEGVVPPHVVAQLAKRLPVVAVAGDPAQRSVDVVAADNWSGAHAIVEHLVVDHGKRRLFHVDGPPSAPDAKVRRLAMRDVITAHPGVTLIGSCNGRFSVRSGEAGARQMLAAARREGALPDAVVCANDQMAIGVLQGLAAHGVRVPQDIAVTGFDDIFPASLCEPPLTTVHQPIRQLGEHACDRLLARISDPSMRRKVDLLPTELVLRSSCGCPPGTQERRPVRRRKPAVPPQAHAAQASVTGAAPRVTTPQASGNTPQASGTTPQAPDSASQASDPGTHPLITGR